MHHHHTRMTGKRDKKIPSVDSNYCWIHHCSKNEDEKKKKKKKPRCWCCTHPENLDRCLLPTPPPHVINQGYRICTGRALEESPKWVARDRRWLYSWRRWQAHRSLSEKEGASIWASLSSTSSSFYTSFFLLLLLPSSFSVSSTSTRDVYLSFSVCVSSSFLEETLEETLEARHQRHEHRHTTDTYRQKDLEQTSYPMSMHSVERSKIAYAVRFLPLFLTGADSKNCSFSLSLSVSVSVPLCVCVCVSWK